MKLKGNRKKRSRGQGTVEYILMVAVGAVFALQIAGYFNNIFRDGVRGLEGNIQTEMKTGQGFTQ